MPKKVVTILLWIKDIVTLEEYLYGLADDKKSIIRSEDYGLTWKFVTMNEYNTVYYLNYFYLNY